MKITNITKIQPRTVYAIKTSTNTFISDGLAHHNCAGCNIFGNGKPLDFEEHLKEELGDELVEEMKKSRHKITILSRPWYSEQIDYYKSKLKELNV